MRWVEVALQYVPTRIPAAAVASVVAAGAALGILLVYAEAHNSYCVAMADHMGAADGNLDT